MGLIGEVLRCDLERSRNETSDQVTETFGLHINELRRSRLQYSGLHIFTTRTVFIFLKIYGEDPAAGLIFQLYIQRDRTGVCDRKSLCLTLAPLLRTVGHGIKRQIPYIVCVLTHTREAQPEAAALHPARVERGVRGNFLHFISPCARCVVIPAGTDIAVCIIQHGELRAVVFRDNDRIWIRSVPIAVQCELPAGNELYVLAARICGEIRIGDEFRRFGVRTREGCRLFGIDICGTDEVERCYRTGCDHRAAGRGQLGGIAEFHGIRLVEQLDLAIRDAQLGAGAERNSPPCRRIDGMAELAAAHGKSGAADKEKLIAAVLCAVVLNCAARHRNGRVLRIDRAAIAIRSGGFVAADLGAAADLDGGGLILFRRADARIDRAAVSGALVSFYDGIAVDRESSVVLHIERDAIAALIVRDFGVAADVDGRV